MTVPLRTCCGQWNSSISNSLRKSNTFSKIIKKKKKKSLHSFFLLWFHPENRTKPVNPLRVNREPGTQGSYCSTRCLRGSLSPPGTKHLCSASPSGPDFCYIFLFCLKKLPSGHYIQDMMVHSFPVFSHWPLQPPREASALPLFIEEESENS